jgi:hypothetical protein
LGNRKGGVRHVWSISLTTDRNVCIILSLLAPRSLCSLRSLLTIFFC